MQGKVVGTSLVVMDSFALPVQGTETRVNAANEANEYMVEYIGKSEKVDLILTFSNVPPILTGTCKGRKTRARHWLVSLTPWLWMLVIRDRRQYAAEQPKVSGPIRRCRSKSIVYLAVFLPDDIVRLTLIVPSPLARSTSALSGRILKTILLLTFLSPNISQYLSARLKTLGFTRINTIN
jgi:hypothetical protein